MVFVRSLSLYKTDTPADLLLVAGQANRPFRFAISSYKGFMDEFNHTNRSGVTSLVALPFNSNVYPEQLTRKEDRTGLLLVPQGR